MRWLKNKHLWLTVAHVGVIAGGIAGMLAFPPAIMVIAPAVMATNALIPSPLSK
jgi:hypothetical protein